MCIRRVIFAIECVKVKSIISPSIDYATLRLDFKQLTFFLLTSLTQAQINLCPHDSNKLSQALASLMVRGWVTIGHDTVVVICVAAGSIGFAMSTVQARGEEIHHTILCVGKTCMSELFFHGMHEAGNNYAPMGLMFEYLKFSFE